MSIARPRLFTNYPDRPLDCAAALEDEFQKLIERAENAGWARREAFEALKGLAINAAAAEEENARTSRAIAETIRIVRGH